MFTVHWCGGSLPSLKTSAAVCKEGGIDSFQIGRGPDTRHSDTGMTNLVMRVQDKNGDGVARANKQRSLMFELLH